MNDSQTYQSPFSWRYGSPEMRRVWSEHNKRVTWRRLWVVLAEAESLWNMVTREQVEDLKAHASEIDLQKSLEVEASVRHDLVAEIRVFASQSPIGGGIIHLGATSMDIKDNADVLLIRDSIDILLRGLARLLLVLSPLIERTADLPVMAFTHLQPAEPTTLGYRLAGSAQDLMDEYRSLKRVRAELKGKGFKGAVGNAAAFVEMFGEDEFEKFEARISAMIGLPFFPVSTQTYPRRQDYQVLSTLASLAGCLAKFALDVRFLQSQPIGELSEPFGERQVGSSAMPFKRNPVEAEKIDSLGRYVSALPQVAWQNTAGSILERTLDDSANRRTILPEAFLALDEMIKSTAAILEGLMIHKAAIERTLKVYAPFAGSERLLTALTRRGADRQKMHEILRGHSLAAWVEIEKGNPNPLEDLICADPVIVESISKEEIHGLLDPGGYYGIARRQALATANGIRLLIDPKSEE
jgi:adenylosuccinate lyase